MVTKKHVLVVALVAITAVVWVFVFLKHKQYSSTLAQSNLEHLNAPLAKKVEKQVADLKKETVTKSVEDLARGMMFFWPGPPPTGFVSLSGVPLSPNCDKVTLDTVMSNRRFRKVLAELGRMDKRAACAVISNQIAATMLEYVPLYANQLQTLTNGFKVADIDYARPLVMMAFEMDSTNDKPVLLTARLDILSLVWIAGLLELHDLKPQVVVIERLAVRQRDDLYNANSLDQYVRAQMLYEASLYNRQILGYALLGVGEKGPEKEAALETSKVQIQERALASFDATVTEFDLPVQSGFMKPDQSVGTVTVKYLLPVTDAVFDGLSRVLSGRQ